MVGRHWSQRLWQVGSIILVVALILTGFAPVGRSVASAQPSAAQQARTTQEHAHTHAHDSGNLAREDRDRGIVYDGLRRATSGKCRGGFEVGNTGQCTHGPDAPPKGKDVKRDAAPLRFAPEKPVPGREAKPGATADGASVSTAKRANDPDARAVRVSSTATDRTARTQAVAGATPGLNVCEGDGFSGDRTLVMYVRASDVPDRFATFQASIQGWAADSDRIYSTSAVETGGTRRVRFRTVVTSGVCQIDVFSVVLSPTGDDNFNNTITELTNLGYNSTLRKYMLFVDANVYCGIGTIMGDSQAGQANANNVGPSYGRSDAGCWSGFVAAHEHNHNLGGVQLDAPNTSNGWHCVDDYDVMCYDDNGAAGPPMRVDCTDYSVAENQFDCDNDDYYSTSPPGGSYLATHWNVVNSKFLINEGNCPDSYIEWDSDRAHARVLPVPSYRFHAFCSPDDEDWTSISAVAGNLYRFETVQLSSNADTILELYNAGGTLLASNDDSGPGLGSIVDYTPTTSGTYYVKVRRFAASSHPTQTYYLRVSSFDFPPQTFINSGPSTYVRDTTPTITYSGTDNSTDDANLQYAHQVDGGAWSAFSSATSVTLPALSQGAHTFAVKARDRAEFPGDPALEDSTPATRSFTVDSVAPVAQAPVHSLVSGSALGTSTVPVTVTWPAATDSGSGLARYVLQRSTNGGSTWVGVTLPSALATTATVALSPGSFSHRFRVQAIDQAGNASPVATGVPFTLTAFQDAPTATVSYPSGTWTTGSATSFYGGTVRYARLSGANARLAVASGAKSVAWISTKATSRGKADVYVDGVKVTATPIDLYAASTLYRQNVFTRALNSATAHTVEVRVLGQRNASSGDTRVDIDAFVVLR